MFNRYTYLKDATLKCLYKRSFEEYTEVRNLSSANGQVLVIQ